MKVRLAAFAVAAVLLVAAAVPVGSQSPAAQGRVFTAADYDRAAGKLAGALQGLVVGGRVDPTWLPDERFWYSSERASGTEIVIVNPATGTRAPAFDHARVAAALSAVAGQAFTAASIAEATLELVANRGRRDRDGWQQSLVL